MLFFVMFDNIELKYMIMQLIKGVVCVVVGDLIVEYGDIEQKCFFVDNVDNKD